MADETCGAPAFLGPCRMPAGHNMGKADVPENHDADPWGLVIDQVVGLAAVYGIDPGQPTTPEQVHDLWGKVVVEIATAARQQGHDLGSEGHAWLTVGSDRWHRLTEHLGADLRIAPDELDDDDDDVLWRKRIRDALWLAYGIGRRHQRDGITFAGIARELSDLLGRTPFDAAERK